MNSNNNPYPTLTSQPIRPYPGMVPPMMPNQFYNQPSTTGPITLGIPLLPNNTPRMPTQNIPTMPVPPTSQTAHNYVHLPQQQVNHVAPQYYTSHNPTQHQNSNIRDHSVNNSGYIELTDSTVPEPAYAPCEMKHEDNAMIVDSNMPRIQYPQLPGPMTPSYSSYSQYPSYQVTSYQVTSNPENSGPIVYDLSLLTGITSREPQLTRCPHCNKHVQTVVGYKTGKGAILSGVFMGCLGGMPLLCSWVPCVLKDFKDAVHYCPVCGEVIGTKKFLVK